MAATKNLPNLQNVGGVERKINFTNNPIVSKRRYTS